MSCHSLLYLIKNDFGNIAVDFIRNASLVVMVMKMKKVKIENNFFEKIS